MGGMGMVFQRSGVSRRTLALGLAGLSVGATATRARDAPCGPPRVLFVCPAGTVKSAIARETLKRRAAAAGVAVEAQSRGLHPEDHVSPGLAAHLRADGLDPTAEPVRAFLTEDLKGVDIVVAFDEAAQAPGLEGARVWEIPSWNDRYDEARTALEVRMAALIAELRARQGRGCPGGAR